MAEKPKQVPEEQYNFLFEPGALRDRLAELLVGRSKYIIELEAENERLRNMVNHAIAISAQDTVTQFPIAWQGWRRSAIEMLKKVDEGSADD